MCKRQSSMAEASHSEGISVIAFSSLKAKHVNAWFSSLLENQAIKKELPKGNASTWVLPTPSRGQLAPCKHYRLYPSKENQAITKALTMNSSQLEHPAPLRVNSNRLQSYTCIQTKWLMKTKELMLFNSGALL